MTYAQFAGGNECNITLHLIVLVKNIAKYFKEINDHVRIMLPIT